MNNTTEHNRTEAEFLQSKYSTNLITRFDLQAELLENLGLTINEAFKKIGALERRVFGIGRNRQCKFQIDEVALYIEKALNIIEKENTSFSSIINTVIENNPLRYTMLDSETKECFVEEMEMLPKFYSVEDLEEYVIDYLPTDNQILASLYNKDSEELEFLESACNKQGLDFEDALKSGS